MKQLQLPVLATAGLFSAALLTGCAAQNEGDASTQPELSSTGGAAAPLADPVFGTYTGTQTIELGAPPSEATHIYLELTCLSAGTLVFQDSDEVTCLEPNKGTTRALSSIPLAPGQASFKVTASEPDVSYELKALYEKGASVQ